MLLRPWADWPTPLAIFSCRRLDTTAAAGRSCTLCPCLCVLHGVAVRLRAVQSMARSVSCVEKGSGVFSQAESITLQGSVRVLMPVNEILTLWKTVKLILQTAARLWVQLEAFKKCWSYPQSLQSYPQKPVLCLLPEHIKDKRASFLRSKVGKMIELVNSTFSKGVWPSFRFAAGIASKWVV